MRNHRSAGVWGTEERAISHFPFMPNGPFELMFLAEPYCFKVQKIAAIPLGHFETCS